MGIAVAQQFFSVLFNILPIPLASIRTNIYWMKKKKKIIILTIKIVSRLIDAADGCQI